MKIKTIKVYEFKELKGEISKKNYTRLYKKFFRELEGGLKKK